MDIRRTVPDKNNKYYLKEPAGYNPCILGNVNNRLYTYSVLANCVGAAVARFNEICAPDCRWLGNRYPGGFIPLAKEQGLETGTDVRPGCIVVMLHSDGITGHVFNIEKVSQGRFYTFESGWNYPKGKYIENRWVTKNQNFGKNSSYKFAGCIYNPNIDPYDIPPDDFSSYKTRTGKYIRFIQWVLVKEGCYKNGSEKDIDGSAGPKTQEAVKVYQKKHGLSVDGWAGPKTIKQMKTDHALI